MRKFKKILLLFALVFICVSCGNSSKVKSVSYSELMKKLNNKDTFFFVVIKDGCKYCEQYIPVVEEVLVEYGIEGYSINFTDLSEEDDAKFYEQYGVNSTPTTIFIKDGQEISILQRIEGSVAKEKLVSRLKNNGYIK